jgi:uncharacterized protein YjiS (DUF1127 family)
MKNSFERYRRFRHYLHIRKQLEGLSEPDLQDAGIKRYQLGAIARRQALKPWQP